MGRGPVARFHFYVSQGDPGAKWASSYLVHSTTLVDGTPLPSSSEVPLLPQTSSETVHSATSSATSPSTLDEAEGWDGLSTPGPVVHPFPEVGTLVNLR